MRSRPTRRGCTIPICGGASSKMCGPASCLRPASRGRPNEERVSWKTGSSTRAFGIDPKNPDPGRVTVRRLNRVEYRNTVRELDRGRLRHGGRVSAR